MNRREFCKAASAAGGASILSSLLNACSGQDVVSPSMMAPTNAPDQPSPTALATRALGPTPATSTVKPTVTETAKPQETPVSTATSASDLALSQIALVMTDDRRAGVARAMGMLDFDSLLGREVLLKPNFNSADPSPGSTHPDILVALLAELSNLDAGCIMLTDRSGMGDTRRVMEQIGVFDLIDGFDCEALVLDDLAEDEWALYRQPGHHWSDGFPVPKLLLDADVVIQTCNLKTHRYGGHFTLSLKNSVGFVAKKIQPGGHDYMTELHRSPYQRLMIAEINAAYEPDLIVLDGVEAFVSGGPAEGKRVHPGIILAGRDRVAMDATGVSILRMFGTTPEVSRGRVFEQEQIARAAELGLGVDKPEQIEFITADSKSEEFARQLQEVLFA